MEIIIELISNKVRESYKIIRGIRRKKKCAREKPERERETEGGGGSGWRCTQMSAPPPDALQRTTLLPDPHTHHELHQQQTRQLKQHEGAVTAPASRNGMAATGGGGEDGQKGSSVHYVFSAEWYGQAPDILSIYL